MFRVAIVRSFCLGLLFGVAPIAFAQEFSADVYNVGNKDAAKVGKVYIKGSKMRIDRGEASPDSSNAQTATPLVLVDSDSQTAVILDPTNHVYMKAEVGPEQSLSFFRVKTIDNACADFEKMAGMGGCKKSGNEAVGGRQTVKYVGKSDDGKPLAMWVDSELNFVVKWQPKSGEVGELRNIKVVAQADSLFETPSGFRDAAKEAESTESTQDTKGDTNKEAPPSTPQ